MRHVIQLGALYRLGGEPGGGMTAVQYVRDGAVIVLSYEPRRSLHRGARRTLLQGLSPRSNYRNEATGRECSGAYLMGHGLALHDALNTEEANCSLRFSNRDYLSTITRLRRI